MPYIDRNESGNIVGIYACAQRKGHEFAESAELYVAAPTVDEIKLGLVSAVQAHLDSGAQALGYDDIKTAATYADEPAVARFQSEGQALRAWRSLCWAHCHVVLADVMAGNREIPTKESLIAELPSL